MAHISAEPPSEFMVRRMMQRIAEEREAERAEGKDPAVLEVDDADPETGEDF